MRSRMLSAAACFPFRKAGFHPSGQARRRIFPGPALTREKAADRDRDFVAVRLKGKVSGVEKTHLGVRDIAFESLGSGRQKERIVFAPNGQKRRLVLAEVTLKLRIQSDVRSIVAEEIELNFISVGTRQIVIVERISIRRDARRVGNTVGVLPERRFGGEEGAYRFAVCLRRVLPVSPDRFPSLAETLFVGVAVLRDDGGDPLGVAQRQSEAGRRAVIENIDREPVKTDDLGKSIDYMGDI